MTITETRLSQLIPNVIQCVEGEPSLYYKLTPWIDSSIIWLQKNILGYDYEPTEDLLPLVEKIVVNKAFAEAIPSLDLSLSPNGFAVISTEGRAPASKERVERLVTSLNSAVDANLVVLSARIAEDKTWRESSIGKWWLATFIPNLNEIFRFKGDKDVFTAYKMMRDIALKFEEDAATRYFGHRFLASIRVEYPQQSSPDIAEIREAFVSAELNYIAFHFRDQKAKCPDPHELWHLLKPVISKLDYFMELKNKWLEEMNDIYPVKPFRNAKKGGYFF